MVQVRLVSDIDVVAIALKLHCCPVFQGSGLGQTQLFKSKREDVMGWSGLGVALDRFLADRGSLHESALLIKELCLERDALPSVYGRLYGFAKLSNTLGLVCPPPD